MRFHRKKAEPPAAPTDYSSRLHDLAPLGSDDDGRPTGEDRHTYDLLPESYVEPVEAPEWLKPHHGRHRRTVEADGADLAGAKDAGHDATDSGPAAGAN